MRNPFVAVLLLVFAGTSGIAESRTEVIGNWTVESEIDPFTDETAVYAWVWDESFTFSFWLRCWPEGFDLFLSSDTVALTEDDLYFIDVGVRIGNSDPVYERWGLLVDQTGVIQDGMEAIRFARRLVESQSKRLVFAVWRMGNRATPEFDISGIERVYPKVAAACNVR